MPARAPTTAGGGPRPPWWQTAGYLLALAALTAALHGDALRGWWTWDDPEILIHAVRYHPWQYYTIPGIWCEQTAAFLTPTLTASFDLDLAIAGPAPGWFFTHHLLSVWGIAAATYALLRVWIRPPWALLGAASFLCSAPLVATSHTLWTRHYHEGLLLSVLAVALFTWSIRDRRPWLLVPAVAAAALAMSAKETFTPLALVLPAIPVGTLRARARAAIPFLVLIPVYLLWRYWMLGVWVGSYGPPADGSVIGVELLRIPTLLFGDDLPGLAVIGAVLAVVGLGLWQLRSARTVVPVVLAVLLIPVLPVADMLVVADRLLLTFAWATGVALAAILGPLSRRGRPWSTAAVAAVIAVAVVAQIHGRGRQADEIAEAEWFRVQGAPIASGDGDLLVWTTDLSTFVTRLAVVYGHHRGAAATPGVILDELDLLQRDRTGKRVLSYDQECGCMRDVTGEVDGLLADWGRRVRVRPLSARLEDDRGWVTADFGPYAEGRYVVLEPWRYGRVPVLPHATTRARFREPVAFRVRYDSPEGWITYSPVLRFGDEPGELLEWSR